MLTVSISFPLLAVLSLLAFLSWAPYLGNVARAAWWQDLFRSEHGGMGLEMISGKATAPGTTLTALTMASGDSLAVRNTPIGADIRLINAWAFNTGAGVLRVRSPRLHDNVQGIRMRVAALDPTNLLPKGAFQTLVPQDTLIGELSGSAVAGKIEQAQLLIWYRDLPGIAARLASWQDILPAAVNELTQEVAITAGATGGYSGAAALNATFDLLKANTDYAVIGATADAACAAMTMKGPDTGNLRVGVPGPITGRWTTVDWFKSLSERLGLPCIPVINSANKAGTTIEVVQNDGGAAVNTTWYLMELKPGVKTA